MGPQNDMYLSSPGFHHLNVYEWMGKIQCKNVCVKIREIWELIEGFPIRRDMNILDYGP